MRVELRPLKNPVSIRGSITISNPFDQTFTVIFDFPVQDVDGNSFKEFNFVSTDGVITDTRWGLTWELTQH